MPTIQQIEADLITDAQSGDLADFTATVNSVTEVQKSQLDPVQIGQALDILASLTTQVPADVAAAASHFMARLGAFTGIDALGVALDDFGQADNYDGMKAIIDHLGDAQKPQLDSFAVDNALNDIIFPNAPTDTAITNAALLDFMTHLGAYADPSELTQAMVFTADLGNLAGTDIIIDHIDAAQKPLLDPATLGDILNVIASPFAFPIDPSVSNPVLLDFMTHLGAYADPSGITQAMVFTADLGNLAGTDIIIDHIDAAQKPLLDPATLGDILNVIASPFAFSIDPSVSNPVLLDFMTHLGAYADPSGITQAMVFTADLGNLAGTDIIIDHIDAAQKPLLDPATLGDILNVIASPFAFPIDPSVSNPVLLDFMTHLGAYADPSGLTQAMAFTAGLGNLAGTDIIIDHTDAVQKPLFDPISLGNILNEIASPSAFPIDPSVSNPVLLDFMTHLGAYVDPSALTQAMVFTAGAGNLAGADIIIDHIDAAQKPLLDPISLGNILNEIASPYAFPIDPSVSNPVLLDFMTHLGAYTDAEAMIFAVNTLAQQGDLTGVRAIVDNIDAAQKATIDPVNLGNVLGAIVANDAGNPSGTAAAATDFMAHLGAYTDGPSIESAVMTVGSNGDWQTAAEILGHLNAAQAGGLSSGFQSWMAGNNVQLTHASGVSLTGLAGVSNTLVAHGANDTLNGDGLSDVLYGFGHGDVLNGGAGSEILIGHGLEILNGGTGSNDFVLDGGGQTSVNNFTLAQNDVLDLRDVLAPTDDLAAHVSNYLQLVDTAGGTEVMVNKTGNATHPWVDIGLVTNFHDTDVATLIATHHLVA